MSRRSEEIEMDTIRASSSTAPKGRCTGIIDGYYLILSAYGRAHDARLRITNLPAEFDLPTLPGQEGGAKIFLEI